MQPYRRWLSDLMSPLTLAAVAAWLAVWFSMGGLWSRDVTAAWWAHGAALAFLILFIFEHIVSARLGPRGFLAICLGLAALALVPIALTPQSAAPILLVLWAAMVAARYEGARLWLMLLAVNAAMAAVMWAYWPTHRYFWINWLGYFSFQAFAALVMRYAAQAEAMSERLRELNAELLAAQGLLDLRARDAERLHLARELHDVAGHKLTALKLQLAALARGQAQHPEHPAHACAALADELMADIRAMVQRSREEQGIGLERSIQRLAAPFESLTLVQSVDAAVDQAPSAQCEVLLRAVQEALTNTAKHSGARTLWVVVQREADRWRLHVRDDGRVREDWRNGNGLTGMQERFEQAGGGLQVLTEGGSLRLEGWLPVLA